MDLGDNILNKLDNNEPQSESETVWEFLPQKLEQGDSENH
jgi:hypothetical protein